MIVETRKGLEFIFSAAPLMYGISLNEKQICSQAVTLYNTFEALLKHVEFRHGANRTVRPCIFLLFTNGWAARRRGRTGLLVASPRHPPQKAYLKMDKLAKMRPNFAYR